METCRLSRSHLQIGKPLPGNIFDEAGQLLLSKGYVPDSQEKIDVLMSRGMYVEVTVFEAHYRNISASDTPPPPVENKFDPFLVRNTLKISLNRLLRGVLDKSATPAQIVDFSRQLQQFAQTDAEAVMAAGLLDHQEDTRVVSHALTTASLCSLLAQRLEWPEARRSSLICAALTMNLGMFELQARLLKQSTPLNPAQTEQVHAHPDASVAALQAIGVSDPVWLAAVAQHHEKPGGGGYPKNLSEPGEDSQIIRLVDILGARASARADRHPQAPGPVLRALFVDEGKSANAALVAGLFKLLGLYPPGSFVKLENNELAVVFRIDAENKAPSVAAVTTASGTPTMAPVRRDTWRKGFSIAGVATYDKVSVGYDLGKLWITKQKL